MEVVNKDVLIKLLWIILLVCTAVSNYMIIAYKANNWNHFFFFLPTMGENSTLYNNNNKNKKALILQEPEKQNEDYMH